MISAGYRSAYQQGYSDAKRDFRKKSKVDVLDRIRAEVESIERYGTNNGHDIWLKTPEEIKKDVLTIIDKYKAESR